MLDSAVWRRFSTVIEVKKPTSIEFIEHLFDSIVSEFKVPFDLEKKSKEVIIENLKGLSPSEIRTILISAISNAVIEGAESVSTVNALTEVYKAQHHNKVNKNDLIEFLNQNSISQIALSEWAGMSLRKIKEITSKKENDV
jgi:AAA+ superfamily predicted ATPase